MSEVSIYYFSGSGNSLALARALAKGTGGHVISIPSVIGRESIRPEADAIGIVFPVYFATNGNGGVPLIVRRFVGKLEGIGPKYVFAVCSHSGAPGTTIESFRNLINARGGRLSAGFAIQMSAPPSPLKKIKDALLYKELRNAGHQCDRDRYRPVYDEAARKLDAICDYVNARNAGTFETSGALRKLARALYLPVIRQVFLKRYRHLSGSSGRIFDDLVPEADRSFRCDEKCNGCGICARVCPADNIKMADRRPVWQHRCENCMACYVWCPKGAIGGEIASYNERYHHPEVLLRDMMMKRQAMTPTGEGMRPGDSKQCILL